MGTKQQHVVAVPMPAQGHLNSLMRFCKLLAQQEGFVVTFVDIHFNPSSSQQADVQPQPPQDSCHSNSHPLIRRAHIPIHGIDLSNHFRLSFQGLIEALASLVPYLEQLIVSLNPPVTCLVSDFVTTFPTQDVADKLGIPRIVLYPFCASRLLLSHYVSQGEHISLDAVMEALETSHTRKEVFCKGLPGLPTLYNIDLSHFKHVVNDSLFMWKLTQPAWQICNTRSHAVVINSFDDLEASTFTAISTSCNVPIYGIGPWIEPLNDDSATSLWKEDDACMTWLNQQPTLSVLYISFGSIAMLSQEQFEEILEGLLSSKHRFLWVLRPDLIKDGELYS